MKIFQRKRFSNGVRIITFLVMEIFLSLTLIGEVALAGVTSPQDHLRPKAFTAQDGGVKELRSGLMGEEILEEEKRPSLFFEKIARPIRNRFFRYALLGLFLLPKFSPASATSSVPLEGVAPRPHYASLSATSPVSWETWKTRLPDRDVREAEERVSSLDLQGAIEAYETSQTRLAQAEGSYAGSLRSYLDALERWQSTRRNVQEGDAMRAFDDEVHRTISLLREFLDARLEAVDQVIQATRQSDFSGSIFDIPDEGVTGRDYTVRVTAKNSGNTSREIKVITVLNRLTAEGPTLVQEVESPPTGEDAVRMNAGSERQFTATFPSLSSGIYTVATFIVDYNALPSQDERFGQYLSQENNPWVFEKRFGRVIVLPPGTTLRGSVGEDVATNLDDLTTPIDETSRYILVDQLHTSALTTQADYDGPIEIPIATEWTLAGQVDLSTNLRPHFSVTPDSTKGGVPSVQGIPGQPFTTSLPLRQAKIIRYYIDTQGTSTESDDTLVEGGELAPAFVQEIAPGIYSIGVQLLMDDIPLLPDVNGDGRSDPWNYGKLLQVVRDAGEVLQAGSIQDVSLQEVDALVMEDPDVPGELILPPRSFHEAGLNIPARLATRLGRPVNVDAVLVLTTERRPNDHLFQYELSSPATLTQQGTIVFPFDIPTLIQRGLLVRSEIDTRGTPQDETDDIVLSTIRVNEIDLANMSNVSFQVLLNATSLLPNGEPVLLGRHFTFANGALRPGSFNLISHNMNEVPLTPSPQELLNYPFAFTSKYSLSPTFAPLPWAYALYEMTFTSVDRRDENNRPFVSYVVGSRMGDLVGRSQSRTDTLRVGELPIVEVIHGVPVGVVPQVPPGPYTVSVAVMDTDADPYPDTQPNDFFDRATRSPTLHVGGLLLAGSDTLSTSGDWVVEGGVIYTNGNGSVTYRVDLGPEVLRRNMIFYTRNRSSEQAPLNYRFNVKVSLDGVPLDVNGDGSQDNFFLPADRTGGVKTGGGPLGELSGVHDVTLEWFNDQGTSTNLEIHQVLVPHPSNPASQETPRPLTDQDLAAYPKVSGPLLADPQSERGADTAHGAQGVEGVASNASNNEALRVLQKRADHLGSQLEKRLIFLPEAQRPMLQTLFDHLRSDRLLVEAEGELRPFLEAMQHETENLQRTQSEVGRRLNQVIAFWEEVIEAQPWESSEKARARVALHRWAQTQKDLQEARTIFESAPLRTLLATSEWFEQGRRQQGGAYTDLRLGGLNLEGPEDVTFEMKWGNRLQLGDADLSFLVGGRTGLPTSAAFLNTTTEEEEQFLEQRDAANAVLDDVKRQLADAERRGDEEAVARLNERGIALRDERDAWHRRYAESIHRRHLLDPSDFYYGIQGEFFPHGTGLGVVARVKAYGSPIRIERRLPAFENELLGLQARGISVGDETQIRFALPTRYDFLNNIAWNFRDVLELGYSGAILWDPSLWTLESHFGEIQVTPTEALRLGGEFGLARLHTSFEDYVASVAGEGGTATHYAETLRGALDEAGVLLSTRHEARFTRGSLYYRLGQMGSVGLATDFDRDYQLRLRGALFGTQFNVLTALSQEAKPRFNLHLVHGWRNDISSWVALGQNEIDGWTVGVGIQTRLSGSGSEREKRPPQAPHLTVGSLTPTSLLGSALPSDVRVRRDQEGTSYSGPTWGDLARGAKAPLEEAHATVGRLKGDPSSDDRVGTDVDQAIQNLRISHALSQKTGLSQNLFIEKLRLLDPETRNLIGKISDKLVMPQEMKVALEGNPHGADQLLKLHVLLGHYFKGGEGLATIQLPQGFNIHQMSAIDFVDMEAIQQETTNDLMTLVFPESQQQTLNDQLLEARTHGKQL